MNPEENKVPSKEDIVKFYTEQIEVAKMRKELASLNADIADAEAKRIEAIARAAHYTTGPASAPTPEGMPPGVVDHVVTQEDLDNNPELIAEGIKVGDHIGITSAPPTPSPVEPKKDRKLAKV